MAFFADNKSKIAPILEPSPAKYRECQIGATLAVCAHFTASNGLGIICCNTVGFNGRQCYPGGAWAADGGPKVGKCIPLTLDKARLREKMLVFRFSADRLAKQREAIAHNFANRRPELYGLLVRDR